jgi:hypothetical protein
MNLRNKIAVAVATTLTSLSAVAQLMQSHSTEIPMSFTNWNIATQLPKFDPNLGVLKSVKFNYTGKIETQFAFENRSRLARSWSAELKGQVSSKLQNLDLDLFQIPLSTLFTDTRQGFDGVLDFAGPSGIRTNPILMQESRNQVFDLSNSSYSYMANFIGTDNLVFQNSSSALSYYNGPGDYRYVVRTTAGAQQSVDYVYEKAQCARSPGYWKNHIKKLGVTQLTIAGMTYNQMQLLNILQSETTSGVKSNSPYIKLARAVIASKLSIIKINAQFIYVLPYISQAEQLLTGVSLNEKTANISKQQKEEILNLKNELEKFHNGQDYNQPGVCKNQEDDCKED